MATLVLGALGTAIGSGFGGAILGLSGAAIGGAIGSFIGGQVDQWALAQLAGSEHVEGTRLDALRVTSSTEGAVLPQVFGRMRLGGNIIWATDFLEEITTRKEKVSKYQKVTVTEYSYSASLAVAICEGPITGIGRIWADGELMDLTVVTWRWYPGDEAQDPDPLIAEAMGDETPAYRGTAYVVFEALALEKFGNRLPQLSFEIYRPLDDADAAEGLVRAVTMIPGSGEFVYATEVVKKGGNVGEEVFAFDTLATPDDPGGAENENYKTGTADMLTSLDQLEASMPAVESVSLVVSWFGDDLRAGSCTIMPKVELASKATSSAWGVDGVNRATAGVVSSSGGSVAFGGTPADFTVVQAIQEMKTRGLRVTFYPFILMDVAEGNTLPNPYSDGAADAGQPVYPWRGRITCSPAAGFTGTVDQTATAAAQVAAFFGAAEPGDFAVSGTEVTWTGGADWGYRRMILHYAHLCAAAGGVDSFLIGSELRGLTTIRSDATTYPAVAALRSLAAAVRAILGPDTAIGYAADWSEYFGHQPGDGSGDVFFHLDPLWADAEIDFVGIDNYMPLSDWRDGFEHLDAQAGWPSIYDRAYLQANIEGGEGFDWYYASAEDRAAQTRTPILDSYPVSRDIAVAREIEGAAIIGPTGLIVNAFHEELGRDGYFHPDSGTSEGQFLMMHASARASLALTGTDPAAAASYSDRSRLLAAPLEETFFRRPYTSDTGVLLVPHWLNAARASFELQTAELAYPVTFTSIGGGQLRGVIPASAGGDVLLEVYSARASDATLLWENPYSPVIGTQYTQSSDPVTDETGTEVYISGTSTTEALVAFSFNRGDTLEVGQPYEAWPIWRRLEAGEVACAGDAMRWAILAFEAMDALHGGTTWSDLADVSRASTVTALQVDDGRWMLKPSRAADPYATAGLYTFDSRTTVWTRDSGGGFRAVVAGTGESQIGRGVEFDVAGGETITVRIGASIATGDVEVFIDTAASYSAATRWVATLSLAGTGVETFVLDLSDFERLSDSTPLSGPFTVYGFGAIDREAAAHVVIVESARPTLSNDPTWTPWIVPFTINVLGGDIIDWRGVPGTGYQAPDLWAEIGGTDGPDGMLAHVQFLRAAQLAWQTDVGDLGPFAHSYVWDRFDADEFGASPGDWLYTWHDPNSKWAGYQYRPLEATARAIARVDGDGTYATAMADAIDVVADYLAWLDGTGWTSSSVGPPTDFPETGAETNYDEPHFAALILRACVFALESTSYRADSGRETVALSLAARAWAYLEGRYVSTGEMAGTWGGGAVEWYGFWQAEIVDTLAELLLDGASVAAELTIDAATVRSRLVASDAWLEAHSAATLGSEDGESWIFRFKDLTNWWTRYHHDRPGGTRADEPTAWEPQSKPIRFTEFGCPAIDRGTNQPNVFVDPKSSESFVPYFSRGWRDDAIQRAYLEAVALYWGETANNPISAVYGEAMVDLAECAAWTWDARPFPNFPGLTDVWADGANWRLGHWLTGRMGSVSLGPLVRTLCERAGLDALRLDVSGLWGSVEGYVIGALESPRASIAMLARHFGFDAVESGGVIRFTMRGQARAVTVTPDDMVAGTGDRAEPMELTRGQETELAQALKWTLMRSDEDYDSAMVEARRTTAASTRISSESFPVAVAPEEAERRVRRALTEAWVARETASFRLPPSLLALDPSDVIGLAHDGRTRDYRVMTIADAEARTLSAVLQDRDAYDLPPGAARAVTLNTPVAYVPPVVAVLDLPQIFEGREAYQPLIAAWASPWPGTMAVWRSPSSDGFTAFTTFNQRAQFGTLVEDLGPGTPAIWYRGGMVVQLASGTIGSVDDLDLFGGANLLALEVGEDQWELIQAGGATLIDTRTYSLDRILRGQRGTEWLIGDTIPAGARVVVIDSDIASLPVLEAEIGLAYNYRVGPAVKAMAETSYAADTVTATGAGLKPFAPAHFAASLNGSGDVELSWIRRDRALSADSWTYGDVPMSEETEAYRIDILEDATAGAPVLRSIETTTTAATYSAADQTEDFGAPLGIGDSLTMVAYQISAALGPGFPARVTVTL